MNPQAQQRYSLEQLDNYIALMIHLTGVTPESLTVTPDFYTWYVQTVMAAAEELGLAAGFKVGGQPTFKKVALVKGTGEAVKTETVSVDAATESEPKTDTPPAPAEGVPAVEAAPVEATPAVAVEDATVEAPVTPVQA